MGDPFFISGPAEGRYEVVGFNSASRDGAPLARLIKAKSITPNSAMRFCTEEAKVNTIFAYLEVEHGMTGGQRVIGLRHDEGHRLLKGYAKNAEGRQPWPRFYPLDKSRVTKADVHAFWWGEGRSFETRESPQGFDLDLRPNEGNCDLCFLLGRGALKNRIRDNPAAANWWIEQERVGKGWFVTEYSYATLLREVLEQPHFFEPVSDDERDAECGDECDSEAA